jgi:uncharacterized protein (DUF885 family)
MMLTRRHVAAAMLASLAANCATGSGDGASAADVAFEVLVRRYIDATLQCAPVTATQLGDHRFDRELDNVSAAARAARAVQLRAFASQLATMERGALTRANQVDAAILDNQLRYELWSLERQQSWAWNTLSYNDLAGNAIYGPLARDYAPIGERLTRLTERMEKIPELLAQTRAEIVPARVPAPYAQTYAQQNPGVKSIIEEMLTPQLGALSGEARLRMDRAIILVNEAVDGHQSWIEAELVPNARGEWRAGAQMFDEELSFALVSTLSRQEIRQRAEAELIQIRTKMYQAGREALAGRAGAPEAPDAPTHAQQQAVIAAALAVSGAERPTRTNLMQVATEAVREAEAFVREKDFITLPDEPVRVITMPEFQQGVSIAYCDPPGPLERNLGTFYAVSPIPDSWSDEQAASFLREYNNRAVVDIGVHEAMPGHYVQIWHANGEPSLLRAMFYSGSFVEGWACYAEALMVEQGFKADDPLYRLAQLKVQLRTVTNAILDQSVHVDGMSEADALRFLTETAFQEEREAAGKWRRAQLSSTQLSTYFVGLTEHQETRAAAEARPGFNLKAYHDGILSFGSPPMRFARALLFEEPIV